MSHSTKKHPRNPLIEEVRLASGDEALAVEFLEARRWGSSPVCPRCASDNVYQMAGDGHRGRNKGFRWRCRGCCKMYSVRTGTVLEESRIAIKHWLHCFWSAAASKKGISAMQISRECSLSYKSALFLMHRIRLAMRQTANPENGGKLSGTVEADETYVGGKPRNKGGHNKRGRGTKKTPVLGMVERDGRLRLRVLTTVNAKSLRSAIVEHVDASSRLLTDELAPYRTIGKMFLGGHDSVKHSAREYVRGDVHSNTIESAFAILKRGIYGTFHAVSKKHLHRYLGEFEFRYDTRKLDDGARLEAAIKSVEGKRLTYKEQTEAAAL